MSDFPPDPRLEGEEARVRRMRAQLITVLACTAAAGLAYLAGLVLSH